MTDVPKGYRTIGLIKIHNFDGFVGPTLRMTQFHDRIWFKNLARMLKQELEFISQFQFNLLTMALIQGCNTWMYVHVLHRLVLVEILKTNFYNPLKEHVFERAVVNRAVLNNCSWSQMWLGMRSRSGQGNELVISGYLTHGGSLASIKCVHFITIKDLH